MSSLFDSIKKTSGKGEEAESEERKKGFLNMPTEDDLKRRHNDSHEALRKNKREKKFEKMRGITPSDLDGMMSEIIDPAKIASMSFTIGDLPTFITLLNSAEVQQVYLGIIGIRKLLAKRETSPIQEIIDENVVPRIIALLDASLPQIQYEASWCLTNIATGTSEQIQCLTEKGVIPKFISKLSSEHENIRDQAAWALGNIAGENTDFRDMVIYHGVIPELSNMLMKTTKEAYLKNGVWALSNLVRGEHQPEFSKIQVMIPVLAKIIKECNDKEILSDALWTLQYIQNDRDMKVRCIFELDLLPRITQLLEHPSYGISVPCLRLIGLIVTGDEKQTQIAIDTGVIRPLGLLLSCPKESVRKEAAWALSNITAGTTDQLQRIIDEHLMHKIIEMSMSDIFEVRRECIWAISNASSEGSPEQILFLINSKAVEALCNMLTTQEARTLAITLEGLEHLLKKTKPLPDSSIYKQVLDSIENCGGLSNLENLQTHNNSHVYKKAEQILETYFEIEEIDMASESMESISIFKF